jgi:PAS domain S-box-containing protein
MGSLMFIHNPFVSKETAMLAMHISAPAWVGFSSIYVWFILIYTGKLEKINKKWLYWLLFFPPLVLLYIQWNGNLLGDLEYMTYGWKPLYVKNIWPYIHYAYYLIYMAVGLYINAKFIRKTTDISKKKQAKIILTSIVIILSLGTITDTLLPLLDIHVIPNIAGNIVLIWAISVIYAMVKYKFLSITPATASENIISTMFDCLILLDLQGKIVRVNKATGNLSGYGEKELIGKPVTVLLKDDRQQGTEKKETTDWLEMILNDSESGNRDLLMKSKSNGDTPVLFSTSMMKDDTGAAVGMVCVAKDITERKKLETESLKTKKLEAVGVLAGGIAHDFNNLLSVIIGNVGLAKEETIPGQKEMRFLNNAEEAAEMAADLASKFITFSRGGWLAKEKISLSTLLKNISLPSPVNVTGENNASDPDRITLKINLASDLLHVMCDVDQMRQVLQNILLNAVEAIPDNKNGLITIEAENIAINENDKFPVKAGEYAKLTIMDDGKGIPSPAQDKIFDPYFSTKSMGTQKGMGLGLTVCYSIIKKHDGHITFQSQEGEGTTVTIYLPTAI